MIAGLVYDRRVSTWVTVADWIARNRGTSPELLTIPTIAVHVREIARSS